MSGTIPEEDRQHDYIGIGPYIEKKSSKPPLFPILPFLKNKAKQANVHSACKYLLVENHAVFPTRDNHRQSPKSRVEHRGGRIESGSP